MTLADQIRTRLGDDASARTAALLAVVDECNAMHAASQDPRSLAELIANQLEQVIARELGIQP